MRKITLVIALVAAAIPAAAAHADMPPVPGGTNCSMAAKPAYRLAAVRGLPVKLTCDGPATMMVGLDFSIRSRAHRWVFEHLFTDSDPGMEAFTRRDVVFTEAGSRVVRLRFWPWARRVLPRFPRTEVHLLLAIKRADGEFWSAAAPGHRAKSVLVR